MYNLNIFVSENCNQSVEWERRPNNHSIRFGPRSLCPEFKHVYIICHSNLNIWGELIKVVVLVVNQISPCHPLSLVLFYAEIVLHNMLTFCHGMIHYNSLHICTFWWVRRSISSELGYLSNLFSPRRGFFFSKFTKHVYTFIFPYVYKSIEKP